MVPSEGPHAEVTPSKLHFQADVKKQSTQTIRLRNTGTAVIQFEWVQNVPEQSFQVQTMFSFTAGKSGNFTSSWCLKTYPELKEPITELAMNGSATLGDLHWERRAALQEFLMKEQTVSLASELAEDVVEAVRLQPPPLPPLSEPAVQDEGLFWSPGTWEAFTRLREQVESMVPEKPAPDEGNKRPGFMPRPGRGRTPVAKVVPPSAAEPLPPLESLGVPSLNRMRAQLEQLPGTEPGAERPAEKYEVIRQLDRASRTARKCPLERSPIWWMAHETVMEIALSVPGKWAATRQRNGLEPLPFLPPPDENASPEEVEEYNLKLEERKSKMAPEEKEAEVRDIFCRGFMRNKFGPACDRFDAVAKESTLTSRMIQAGRLSLGDRLRPYLGRLLLEAVELASNVVLYELDLGFLERPQLLLQGSDLELLKQRLRGVVSVLESVPLAVLVMTHLGEPMPEKPKVEDEEMTELQQVQARMSTLATMEPLLEILREVVGSSATSVEFVPHEAWCLGSAEFAQKVRNEDVEGKVFLLENLSATGLRRTWFTPSSAEGQAEPEQEVALQLLPWATREGWAARALRDIQPESMVQDALAQSCQPTTLSTGLWPRAPQRVVGPSIEVELAAFLDVLQLPIRGTAAEEEAARAELEQSVAVDEEGKAAAPAPLLIVLGGGGFSQAEARTSHSWDAQDPQGGVHVLVAGELASCLLSGVFGMSMGAGLPLAAATKAALRQALLEVMRAGVTISLPLDMVCQANTDHRHPPTCPGPVVASARCPRAKSHLRRSRRLAIMGLLYHLMLTSQSGEYHLDLDPAQGLLRLRDPHAEAEVFSAAADDPAAEATEAADANPTAEGTEAAGADAHADAGADEGTPQEPPEIFPDGVPEKWMVKDIGPATIEQLRILLRRSRGAVWNGSLGCCEDGFQKGTTDFIALLEGRLTGAGEERALVFKKCPSHDLMHIDVRSVKEKTADFEMAAVLGRDSRKLLETFAENTANVPFISGTGEGLLQILRGAPVPGLKACDLKPAV
eukprot:g33741.t1